MAITDEVAVYGWYEACECKRHTEPKSCNREKNSLHDVLLTTRHLFPNTIAQYHAKVNTPQSPILKVFLGTHALK
jgi:hypothetical protein